MEPKMESMLPMVISKDGTPIRYEVVGDGPLLILVSPALGRGHDYRDLAERLLLHFTVLSYDRRGRGESGDTPPYAVAREIEDIEALIDANWSNVNRGGANGGGAFLYGLSSGAVLALEAAAALPDKVKKVALYEAPFVVDASHAPLPADYIPHLQKLAEEGRRGEAVEYFMTAAVGIPPEYLAGMKGDEAMWGEMESVAHTLWYDGTVMGDTMRGQPLAASQAASRWRGVTMPALVMNGGASDPFMAHGADEVAALLPNAHRRTLDGQGHGPDPDPLAAVLIDFFTNQE
jgi:pimeloyl-ACP methyl ester carboxylesterase